MAKPSLPSFAYSEPENFIVRIGTGTGTSGVLGHVKSISGRTTANRPKKTYRRVGSSTAESRYQAAEYESTCEIGLYAEEDATDYMAATGDNSPAQLDVENEITIRVEVYDDSGNLTLSWQLDEAAPVDSGFNISEDADETIRLTSLNKWVKTIGS